MKTFSAFSEALRKAAAFGGVKGWADTRAFKLHFWSIEQTSHSPYAQKHFRHILSQETKDSYRNESVHGPTLDDMMKAHMSRIRALNLDGRYERIEIETMYMSDVATSLRLILLEVGNKLAKDAELWVYLHDAVLFGGKVKEFGGFIEPMNIVATIANLKRF